MELLPGITKEFDSNCTLYFIHRLSDELKEEIRKRLVRICHGEDQALSTSLIFSYKTIIKEFLTRYDGQNKQSKERKKGLISELLVHVILEIEGTFTTASPFFNMEERSFKKGYDIALFNPNSEELWIAEVKSGELQAKQKSASSSAIALINTAKNDLKQRLNDPITSLWYNAICGARVSMSNSNHQKDAVLKLLEKCGDNAASGNTSSSDFNVVLSATLFHPITADQTDFSKIKDKYLDIVNEHLFKNVLVIVIQKSTFNAVYEFVAIREETRKVDGAGLIRIDNNFYRLPSELINKGDVQILVDDSTVIVSRKGVFVAELDKATSVYRPSLQKEQGTVSDSILRKDLID